MRSWVAVLLGFVLGVLIALAASALIGYSVYQTIQERISPESIREKAEQQFRSILGEEVEVGQAQLSLPNLLTLENVKLGPQGDPWLVVEKIEAAAEGGVAGLEQGRFAELVLTRPVVKLSRSDGGWNFTDALEPLLTASAAPAAATGTGDPQTNKGVPIKVIQVVDLTLEARSDGGEPSTLQTGTLLISRENIDAPWTIYGDAVSVVDRLNGGDWLLRQAAAAGLGLFAVNSGTPKTTVEAPGSTSSGGSGVVSGFRIENLTIQAFRPEEVLSLDGVSVNFDQVRKFLNIQTGGLEKKTPHTRA